MLILKLTTLPVNLKDINTWGTIATFIGLIISIITLIVANNVRKVTQRLQSSIVFDRRVPSQLKAVSSLLSDFNALLNNTGENVNQVKSLLAQLRSEIVSLSSKITDRATKKLIRNTVRKINRNVSKDFVIANKNTRFVPKMLNSIFKATEDDYWQSYTSVGEIHRSIDNLYKDKKATIKP